MPLLNDTDAKMGLLKDLLVKEFRMASEKLGFGGSGREVI